MFVRFKKFLVLLFVFCPLFQAKVFAVSYVTDDINPTQASMENVASLTNNACHHQPVSQNAAHHSNCDCSCHNANLMLMNQSLGFPLNFTIRLTNIQQGDVPDVTLPVDGPPPKFS